MRTIIFGDIHGCYEEWAELLKKVNATDEDQIIAVGDLVAKGPSAKRVLDLAMSLTNFKSVLGNHDSEILIPWKENNLASITRADHRKVIDEFGDEIDKYMRFIDSWPLYLDLPECVVIHAGLRPGITLEDQDRNDLLNLRTVGSDNEPWYESYQGEKLIVHGHWAKQGLMVRSNVIGLDSGCVYGKSLTALILPAREIKQVQAHRAYQPIRS